MNAVATPLLRASLIVMAGLSNPFAFAFFGTTASVDGRRNAREATGEPWIDERTGQAIV